MITHKFKTCRNKGHARIWIEGQRLLQSGWNRGDRFDRTVTPDGILLERKTEGRHKIAGTADRPIIDLNGAWVTEAMQGAPEYTAIISKNRIAITKEATNAKN